MGRIEIEAVYDREWAWAGLKLRQYMIGNGHGRD